jgi:hypothetical protein
VSRPVELSTALTEGFLLNQQTVSCRGPKTTTATNFCAHDVIAVTCQPRAQKRCRTRMIQQEPIYDRIHVCVFQWDVGLRGLRVFSGPAWLVRPACGSGGPRFNFSIFLGFPFFLSHALAAELKYFRSSSRIGCSGPSKSRPKLTSSPRQRDLHTPPSRHVAAELLQEVLRPTASSLVAVTQFPA